jgi:DUF2075 family protein
LIKNFHKYRDVTKTKVYLVKGAPGTGKTVLITYLMKLLRTQFYDDERESYDLEKKEIIRLIKELKLSHGDIALVIPKSSLRATLRKVFKNAHGLSADMVIGPFDLHKHPKKYDLVLVDEAHRLCTRINNSSYSLYDSVNKKLGLDKQSSQLDWVLNKSLNCVLFYDDNQSIIPADIPAEVFKSLNPVVEIELKKQIRVKGGDSYLAFLRNMLEGKGVKESRILRKKFMKNYQLKVYDDIEKFSSDIIKKARNSKFKFSRITAGYSWKYKTKKNNKLKFDFTIQGKKFKWNSPKVSDWVHSEGAMSEVGCIHNVQGYDLNFSGVIFGPEISYDFTKKEITIDRDRYADRSGKNSVSDKELKSFILNIYYVLLTRGMDGTYIYVCDENFRKYVKSYFV